MNGTVRIEADMTVNEVIRLVPETVAVFRRYGIDACCGGSLRVGEAATRHGHDVHAVLTELENIAVGRARGG